MTDIEKAIEYFKCARDNTMIRADVINSIQGPLLFESRKKYAQLAATALEKQIPKKPDIIVFWAKTEVFYCPCCGKKIISKVGNE